MSLADRLTPRDTEEVKPGLFIQKRTNGSYRMINPMAWDGKLRTKEQLKTVFSLRTIFTIALIIFIAYNYRTDNVKLLDFYNRVHENPIYFCQQVTESLKTPECSEQNRLNGLCFDQSKFNLSSFSLNESASSLS